MLISLILNFLQAYVKTTKIKFDRLTLACLQKVDLLAAARCNMFSHALVPYQNSLCNLSSKAAETLTTAANKVEATTKSINRQLNEGEVATGKANINNENDGTEKKEDSEEFANDKDKKTFFNAEYSDNSCNQTKSSENDDKIKENILLGYDFSDNPNDSNKDTVASSNLLDLSWPSPITEEASLTSQHSNNFDFLGNDFMPSKLLQAGELDKILPSIVNDVAGDQSDTNKCIKHALNVSGTSAAAAPLSSANVNSSIKSSQNNVSWLSLFADLDPLSANQDNQFTSQDRV